MELLEDPNIFFSPGADPAATYLAIREMEIEDPALLVCFEVLESILGFDRYIEGDSDIADFVRENLVVDDWHNLLYNFMQAIKGGYVPYEIVYKQVSSSGAAGNFSKIGIENILDWPPWKFKFRKSGELVIIPDINDGSGVIVDPQKFKTISYRYRFGDMYGNGKYQATYWLSKFSRIGLKAWTILLERYGGPIPIISSEDGALSTDDHNNAVDFLTNMRTQTGLVLDGKIKAILLEASKGIGNDYDKFVG